MKQICLFGAGRIGQVHAQAINSIRDKAKIKYVVDVFEDAAKTLAHKIGASSCDVDTALNDSEIDAVIIASSTDTHADLLKRSAEAGKAIFCEKPLDLDLQRAIACASIIDSTGVPCSMGFNRRYDPQFGQLHQHINNGKIGQLETLIITSRDPEPPPCDYIGRSGGLFKDMTIHDFDMARWLLGENPIEIYASGSNLIDPAIADAGDIDTAIINLKTATGKLVVINNSRRTSYGYDQRIEAFGSKGMLQAVNQTESLLQFTGDAGTLTEKPVHFFLERYADAYRLELIDFLNSQNTTNNIRANHHDGVAALRLAEAAQQSYQTNQPVSLV